ncbi:MAG TPA: SMI1/KNR4 family protein [Gemmatimonadaceae bacterium]|nr:SMI1/KNR4 family protein [Gemmatimonadaceae bacterium]
MESLERILDSFADTVSAGGGEAAPVSIADPVAESAVSTAERQLGYSFPPLFRRFLTTTSGGMEFSWNLDDEITLEGEREAIFGGELRWSFDELVSENRTFQAQDIEGDELLSAMVGRDKVILSSVPNGDMFAVGVSGELQDRILYLSHDIEDIHNYVVASDIEDLLRRYAPLGFAGPEFWIWEQFTNGRTTMIDPSSAKAKEFLAMLAQRA